MSRKNWSNEKIFERLITNKSRKTYWDNIGELRSRPNKEVFQKSFNLLNSESKKEKLIGIDILAQLGFNPRPFKKETLKRYFELLNEENDKEILMSILYGIGHNNEELTAKQIVKLIQYKTHKNVEVRQGLVSALLGIEDEKAVNTLIELTQDKVSSIRNWATFGIGSQIELSNHKIKTALWDRVNDRHQETKLEAIIGLSNRGEKEVKKIISRELNEGEYGTLLFEAIETLNDREFLPQLEKNYESAKDDDSIPDNWIKDLKECIEKLKNKNGAQQRLKRQ